MLKGRDSEESHPECGACAELQSVSQIRNFKPEASQSLRKNSKKMGARWEVLARETRTSWHRRMWL